MSLDLNKDYYLPNHSINLHFLNLNQNTGVHFLANKKVFMCSIYNTNCLLITI